MPFANITKLELTEVLNNSPSVKEGLIDSNNESGLHHYLNSKDKKAEGARAFMTGILVSKYWDLNIRFAPFNEKLTFMAGFAHIPINEIEYK